MLFGRQLLFPNLYPEIFSHTFSFFLFAIESILQPQNHGNWSSHFISLAISAWVILDPALRFILGLIHLMAYIYGQKIVAWYRSWCISFWQDKIWWCKYDIAGRFKWVRCLCSKQNESLHCTNTWKNFMSSWKQHTEYFCQLCCID